MRKTILLAIAGLAWLPGLAPAASPLRLECAADQDHPGRALVCEYSLVGRLNAQLAGLHERIASDGREGRVDARRWLSARDACRDVDCLDGVLEAGIADARRALVDVESREPAPVLANARGVTLRVVQKPVRAVSLPPTASAPEESRPPVVPQTTIAVLTLLFALAAVAYLFFVLWRFSIRRPERKGYEYEWVEVDGSAGGLRHLTAKGA